MTDGLRPGVLCVYKPSGPTSHDIVYKIRKLTGMKTGHTGTLDPSAEGILPICLGAATKIAEYITSSDKRYSVEVIFGAETDTQDATGIVTAEKPLLASKEEVLTAVSRFVGNYNQTPPMYSAIKKNGKKLYELARAGLETTVEPRLVKILSINVSSFDYQTPAPVRMVLDVNCSKGAYMRTLCHDLGRALDSCAHMGKLVRTEAGGFSLSDALSVDYIKDLAESGRLGEKIIPIDEVPALRGFVRLYASQASHTALKNGNPLKLEELSGDAAHLSEGGQVLIFDCEGALAGIYRLTGQFVKTITMLR